MTSADVKIFLDSDFQFKQPELKAFATWCDLNEKWWCSAFHVLAFKGLLFPKMVFFPPFAVAKSSLICPVCLQRSSVIGVLAGGFAPAGEGQTDVAVAISNYLTCGIQAKNGGEVFVAYAREYPADFLKEARKHNFMFRRHSFGDDEWSEETYFANLCQHCRQPISDFGLYYEPDGCFSRSNPYAEKALFPLKWNAPLVVNAKFA